MSGPELRRRLGTGDAVVVGLAAMVGAGVFAVFGPAAQAAGAGLLIGLGLAAVIAWCNATASSSLAAVYPTSGGTYVYGRERLGPWWGFAAGWGFVVGKTASCAAMATTFAAYAVPGSWWVERGAAALAVLAVVGLDLAGVHRTLAAGRVLVGLTLTGLGVLVVALATGPETDFGDLARGEPFVQGGVTGVVQAAGLLFFAFAGYARVATLGEEVRDPVRTIPRAVSIALGVTVAVYAVVAVTALAAAGSTGLAGASAPLAEAARAAGVSGLAPFVRVVAAVASLGALLALVAGVGRTTLAMARERDLPATLAAVHPERAVPHHAGIAIGAVVVALVLTVDLRGVIGFSSFGVLVYYAIANAAAATLPDAQRRWPRGVHVLGLLGCVVLAANLPRPSVVAGIAVFAVGVGGRAVVLARRRRSGTPAG